MNPYEEEAGYIDLVNILKHSGFDGESFNSQHFVQKGFIKAMTQELATNFTTGINELIQLEQQKLNQLYPNRPASHSPEEIRNLTLAHMQMQFREEVDTVENNKILEKYDALGASLSDLDGQISTLKAEIINFGVLGSIFNRGKMEEKKQLLDSSNKNRIAINAD